MRPTGTPVQTETTSAMSEALTSSETIDGVASEASASASSFSAAGISP